MAACLRYRLHRPACMAYPGAHPGQMVSMGQLFKRHAPLLVHPDPRRLDIRTSMLDPFQNYRVRVYQQHSTLNLVMIADLSASMNYQGLQVKLEILADLLNAFFEATESYRDNFGFIGCADQILPEWWLPWGRYSAQKIQHMSKRLATTHCRGTSAGLLQLTPYLPTLRSLMILVSDFHGPLTHWQKVLSLLQSHEVVPLVLWDPQEIDTWPDWRLVSLKDMETSQSRTLLLRPKLRHKLQLAYASRKQALQNCMRSFGFEPLYLAQGFDSKTLNRYFAERIL